MTDVTYSRATGSGGEWANGTYDYELTPSATKETYYVYYVTGASGDNYTHRFSIVNTTTGQTLITANGNSVHNVAQITVRKGDRVVARNTPYNTNRYKSWWCDVVMF